MLHHVVLYYIVLYYIISTHNIYIYIYIKVIVSFSVIELLPS